MEILINGECISYTLEGEKNLFDVIASIEKNLAETDSLITALLLNDKTIELDEETLQGVALESIERLDIEVRRSVDLRIEQLETVYAYVQSIERIAKHAALEDAKKPSDYNVHGEDIQKVGENIDVLCKTNVLSYSPVRYLFMYACTMLGLLKKDGEGIAPSEEAADMLGNVLTFLEHHILVMQDHAISAARSNELMLANIPKLISIAQRLTMGDEKCALHYFIASIDFISAWLMLVARVCDNAQGGTEGVTALEWRNEHKGFAEGLEVFLQELAHALEAQDWVTVIDLIEYEIAPQIETHAIAIRERYQ